MEIKDEGEVAVAGGGKSYISSTHMQNDPKEAGVVVKAPFALARDIHFLTFVSRCVRAIPLAATSV